MLIVDDMENWCSLLSVVFAELVLQCAVKGNSKLEKVAPSLATHLMSKGNYYNPKKLLPIQTVTSLFKDMGEISRDLGLFPYFSMFQLNLNCSLE